MPTSRRSRPAPPLSCARAVLLTGAGAESVLSEGELVYLHSDHPEDENSFDNPHKVSLIEAHRMCGFDTESLHGGLHGGWCGLLAMWQRRCMGRACLAAGGQAQLCELARSATERRGCLPAFPALGIGPC